MNRRQFCGHLTTGGLVLATGGTIFVLEGCTSSTVFSDILNWVPVGEDALNGIIKLLTGAGAVNPAAAAIVVTTEAAFSQLEADIKIYQSITPPPSGVEQEITDGLGILVSNFQAFLSAINVSDSTLLTTIAGLVEVVLSTVAGFEALLPAAVAAKLANRNFRIGSRNYTYTAQHRTKRSFKRAYNSVAKAGGHPEIEIPLTLLEHF